MIHLIFLGKGKNRGAGHKPFKLNASKILVYDKHNGKRERPTLLRRALLEVGIQEVCSCGVGTIWNGKVLTLQIDHIDGDFLNNQLENLRFICPNCHTQTENFGRKNVIRRM